MSNTRRMPGWLLPVVAMAIALVAITLWAAGSFSAQAAPDADNEGMIAEGGNFLSTDGDTKTSGWVPITDLSGTLHKAQWKDLVMDVSLECGLYTDTEVKSKGGNKDTSSAVAGVMVRVRVVNADTGEVHYMQPGIDSSANSGVTFCRRSQTLSAVFQGLLTDDEGNLCLVWNAVEEIWEIDEDCLRPEEVQFCLFGQTAEGAHVRHPAR